MFDFRSSVSRTLGTLCVALSCVSMLAPVASAQHHDRDHHRTVVVRTMRVVRPHRHRVVRVSRVRRNGHWVTVRRVMYR